MKKIEICGTSVCTITNSKSLAHNTIKTGAVYSQFECNKLKCNEAYINGKLSPNERVKKKKTKLQPLSCRASWDKAGKKLTQQYTNCIFNTFHAYFLY